MYLKKTTLAILLIGFSSISTLSAASKDLESLDLSLISELHAESLTSTLTEDKTHAEPTASIMFTPPTGWHFAEANALPPSVKVMVIGKGAHEFPPSINLGTEVYAGTLKEYLKRIKDINSSQGNVWKDLGKIRTPAGDVSLSQADIKTQWGEVKLMHVILQEEGIIYILTAAALKEEFPKFYKEFFNSLRSVRFERNKFA